MLLNYLVNKVVWNHLHVSFDFRNLFRLVKIVRHDVLDYFDHVPDSLNVFWLSFESDDLTNDFIVVIESLGVSGI